MSKVPKIRPLASPTPEEIPDLPLKGRGAVSNRPGRCAYDRLRQPRSEERIDHHLAGTGAELTERTRCSR